MGSVSKAKSLLLHLDKKVRAFAANLENNMFFSAINVLIKQL